MTTWLFDSSSSVDLSVLRSAPSKWRMFEEVFCSPSGSWLNTLGYGLIISTPALRIPYPCNHCLSRALHPFAGCAALCHERPARNPPAQGQGLDIVDLHSRRRVGRSHKPLHLLDKVRQSQR